METSCRLPPAVCSATDLHHVNNEQCPQYRPPTAVQIIIPVKRVQSHRADVDTRGLLERETTAGPKSTISAPDITVAGEQGVPSPGRRWDLM